jgi:hypothetical protein
MKRFPLIFFVIGIFVSIARAGSERYSSKETVATSPCPSWYADSEWNVGLSGAYAFTENHYPSISDTVFFSLPLGGNVTNADRYLEADHAWGGAIDLKYFFCRYFGVGIQGFALNAQRSFGTVTILPSLPGMVGSRVDYGTGHERRMVGGVLGTLTLRYPMSCSRLAPYVWIGGGGIFGGGEVDEIIVNDIPAGAFLTGTHRGSETRALGQLGGGIEVRLTPRIGWTNDFSWNVIEGSGNNFGTARTGINFAF